MNWWFNYVFFILFDLTGTFKVVTRCSPVDGVCSVVMVMDVLPWELSSFSNGIRRTFTTSSCAVLRVARRGSIRPDSSLTQGPLTSSHCVLDPSCSITFYSACINLEKDTSLLFELPAVNTVKYMIIDIILLLFLHNEQFVPLLFFLVVVTPRWHPIHPSQ